MNATDKYQLPVKSYRDLIVWKKSVELVQDVYELTTVFTSNERFGLTSQMRRCAISIPSNIAEGWGRKRTGSYVQFLGIASGSLAELTTQLEIAFRLNYCSLERRNLLENKMNELSKMLFVLIQKLEKNRHE
ncbi:MAG: four helix bundle protein [Flavobacteriales bacterium]|jgi:four helix bundle protein